jgi:SAGA-associated factor 29
MSAPILANLLDLCLRIENLEIECWTQAVDSLRTLSKVYASPATVDTIGRVNRLFSTWPTDEALPADGYDGLKSLSKKIQSGLQDIQRTAQKEVESVIPDRDLNHGC